MRARLSILPFPLLPKGGVLVSTDDSKPEWHAVEVWLATLNPPDKQHKRQLQRRTGSRGLTTATCSQRRLLAELRDDSRLALAGVTATGARRLRGHSAWRIAFVRGAGAKAKAKLSM